jgi:LmbE family N-acetylglucosaminyl deacetylase/SAM-dependent methyltransferase
VTAAFSHLDAGTPESLWRDDLDRRRLPQLDTAFDLLVVVAAHPDDETLGAGGLLARADRNGSRVVVVVATDGEASHPHSPTHGPEGLARLRRDETERAVATLSPGAEVRFLGLPDGGLAERAHAFRERLGAVLDQLRVPDPARVVVASPWASDRHRDHRIASEVAGALAARRRFRHIEYPVWAWHWGSPADIPWERGVAVTLTESERGAKQRAIACHVTQVEALSPQPGDEVLLHAGMLEHFRRDVEVFLTEQQSAPSPKSLDAAWFEEFYRRNGDDPWGFETRWYEERKRALLLAALPTRELGAVLEIGCATGLLTRELAARAESVTAVEAASAAVEAARARLADVEGATVLRGSIPDDWPAGAFDTIVLSEVGYYLSAADLGRTLQRADEALTGDGCLVACHWRHAVAAYPQTGDDVHAALRSVQEWETVVLHEERDFVLEVFARSPAPSVAEREGLA